MAKSDTGKPVDRITEHLRQQLRTKWKVTGAKQVAMAELLGKEQSSVSNFFRRQHDLSLDSLDALARFFGTTLADMLADAPPPPESPLLTRLRVALYGVPEAEREMFVQLCEWAARGAPTDAHGDRTQPSPPRPRRTTRAK